MVNKLIIKTAQNVINTELAGIKKLAKIIDSNFSDVIKKLSKVKGKVIFTGIGKSGLVAQKYQVL